MMTVFVMNEFVKQKLKSDGYVKAKFICGDYFGFDQPYKGWHNPNERWNGWATPMFGKKEFCRFIKDLKTNEFEHMVDMTRHDWKETEIENLHEFMSEVIESVINPNPYGMYSFKNCDWCWDDVRS